jgi:GNAT superfamily N-acetyltransferase
MITIIRTDSSHPHFAPLVKLLDATLAELDGDDHEFYAQFNKTAHLAHVVLACDGETPVGCGAIREIEPGTMEVKRMYTLPEQRGKGIAGKVLAELEQWAAELGITRCVLETGKRQPDAISLYLGKGYRIIPNYGQYMLVDNSVCFEKLLSTSPVL